jgi:hypothetical protein
MLEELVPETGMPIFPKAMRKYPTLCKFTSQVSQWPEGMVEEQYCQLVKKYCPTE